MNDEQLREKARKKVAAVKAFYVVASIFGAITVILLVISNQFYGEEAFWIRFPILILVLILAIIYVAMFGLPTRRFIDHAWEEEELEKEIARMRLEQRKGEYQGHDQEDSDVLELKDIDKIKQTENLMKKKK